MATAHRKHQRWCSLAGYFHSRCSHCYFLWQLYSEERFGSAMLIDFSKKLAYWLLFCYQQTSSNWTLGELKRKKESLQLTIIIKEITIQRWWGSRTLNFTIIRKAPFEKEWLTASPLKPRTRFNQTLCKPYNIFKICQPSLELIYWYQQIKWGAF